MPQIDHIPGVEYDFGGGRKYTLAPLTIAAIMSLQNRLAALSDASALTPEAIQTTLDATHASLQRNHPELSKDDVAGLIDVGNMVEVMGLVLDVGGFKRRAADAAKNPPAQPVLPASTGLP